MALQSKDPSDCPMQVQRTYLPCIGGLKDYLDPNVTHVILWDNMQKLFDQQILDVNKLWREIQNTIDVMQYLILFRIITLSM